MRGRAGEIWDEVVGAATRPVRERGAFGRVLHVRRARRGSAGSGEPSGVEGNGLTPQQVISKADSERAHAGVLRDLVARLARLRKRQARHDIDAERHIGGARILSGIAERIAQAEQHVVDRLVSRAPDTLARNSPWKARLATFVLFVGGCIVNATTFSNFVPSRPDALTRLFDDIGIGVAWALGAFQMAGVTFLGYAVAFCLSYACAPRRATFGVDADADAGEEDPDGHLRIVYGHYAPWVYAVLAALFLAFSVLVIYAMARLRMYGALLGGAVSSSAPAGGAIGGTLGAGAAVPGSGDGQSLWIFMALTSLELVAAIAAFFTLDTAISRTVRGLEHARNRALRRAESKAKRVDKSRVGSARVGIDGEAAVEDAGLRGAQAGLQGIELDAHHMAANPGRFPGRVQPSWPELPEIETGRLRGPRAPGPGRAAGEDTAPRWPERADERGVPEPGGEDDLRVFRAPRNGSSNGSSSGSGEH